MTTIETHAHARLARPARLPRLLTGAALLLLAALAGCNTPAHDKDTNASKYNYSYNK